MRLFITTLATLLVLAATPSLAQAGRGVKNSKSSQQKSAKTKKAGALDKSQGKAHLVKTTLRQSTLRQRSQTKTSIPLASVPTPRPTQKTTREKQVKKRSKEARHKSEANLKQLRAQKKDFQADDKLHSSKMKLARGIVMIGVLVSSLQKFMPSIAEFANGNMWMAGLPVIAYGIYSGIRTTIDYKKNIRATEDLHQQTKAQFSKKIGKLNQAYRTAQ